MIFIHSKEENRNITELGAGKNKIQSFFLNVFFQQILIEKKINLF